MDIVTKDNFPSERIEVELIPKCKDLSLDLKFLKDVLKRNMDKQFDIGV